MRKAKVLTGGRYETIIPFDILSTSIGSSSSDDCMPSKRFLFLGRDLSECMGLVLVMGPLRSGGGSGAAWSRGLRLRDATDGGTVRP